ncbi:MAG: polyphosphate kinase 2, partial [Acidimicrobiia bacterium]|nr:polyphosphate kinase 2 [Acidimicrobiia bacterium]
KRWKLSEMDVYSRSRWLEYSRAKDVMMSHTSIPESPWFVVDGDNKKRARLNTISHLLTMVPFKQIEYPEIELPPLSMDEGYRRPPIDELNWVPEVF